MLFSVSRALLERLQSTVDHLQIQKLVYITFGFYAGKYDRYLFENRIEAWPYGPVIPELYHELKNQDFSSGIKSSKIICAKAIDSEDVLETINTVSRIYGEKDGISLVEYTHAKNTPWREIYNGEKSREIPRELIKKY